MRRRVGSDRGEEEEEEKALGGYRGRTRWPGTPPD